MARHTTIERGAEPAAEEAREARHERREALRRAVRSWERLPSPLYLGMSVGSIALSLALFARKRKEDALFVGLWAPTLLALGTLSELHRAGHERGSEAGM